MSVRDRFSLLFGTFAFHGKICKDMVTRANIRIGDTQTRVAIRCGGGDWFIFHEVLKDEVYAPPNDVQFGEIATVVDLGANIGISALYFAARFPDAHIYAVEPHPETACILRENIAGHQNRITVLEAGVADKCGVMRLSNGAQFCGASLVREELDSFEVPVLTMERLFEQFGIEDIDLLKIDIEGAERLILSGAPAWLERVSVMLGELHEGYSYEMFENDVAARGLEAIRLGVAQFYAARRDDTLEEENSIP